MMEKIKKLIVNRRAALAAVLIIALILPYGLKSTFAKHTLFMILIWATCGVAWNMLSGYAGQTSLGHALFYGVGAYVSAMLLSKLYISPWIGMVAGALVAAGMAWVFGKFMFRLSGFYFSIATIALSEVFLVIFKSWSFVGDSRGIFIRMIKDANPLWMMQFKGKEPYCYLALFVLALCMLSSYLLSRSKAGYYFRAIRDESQAAIALGVDIDKYKTIAYMFSAAFCAMAGTIYACYTMYIDPDSVLKTTLSTQICLVAVLGGIGTLWGPVVGSAVLLSVSEIARLKLSGSGDAMDLLLYGLFIIIFAVFQPNGIMGMLGSLKRGLQKGRPHGKKTESSGKPEGGMAA